LSTAAMPIAIRNCPDPPASGAIVTQYLPPLGQAGSPCLVPYGRFCRLISAHVTVEDYRWAETGSEMAGLRLPTFAHKEKPPVAGGPISTETSLQPVVFVIGPGTDKSRHRGGPSCHAVRVSL